MLNLIRTILRGKTEDIPLQTMMDITPIDSWDAYIYYNERITEELASRNQQEMELIQKQARFTVPGYCHACASRSDFLVDYNHASVVDGKQIPNWRERLVCPKCKLNNRLRASVQLFHQVCKPTSSDSIYITEQTTALHAWLHKEYPQVVGSEFLGDTVAPGQCDARGIRNESLTHLSFGNNEHDYILSFDVLEHVPDYRKGFAECLRCLKPGGKLLFSVPFVLDAKEIIVRAQIKEDGEIKHLLPPEYHADPLSDQGCLCFYHFGWQLLDDLRDLGFAKASALFYWSRELGYLGGQQMLLLAEKGNSADMNCGLTPSGRGDSSLMLFSRLTDSAYSAVCP